MTIRSFQKKFAMAALLLAFIVAVSACGSPAAPASDGTEKTFEFLVVDYDGAETRFSITSAAATVGDALLAEGLIEGEAGSAGFYVKVVNGVRADYDKDGHYWAFYINDEMAMTGVEKTAIEDGTVYAFKVE